MLLVSTVATCQQPKQLQHLICHQAVRKFFRRSPTGLKACITEASATDFIAVTSGNHLLTIAKQFSLLISGCQPVSRPQEGLGVNKKGQKTEQWQQNRRQNQDFRIKQELTNTTQGRLSQENYQGKNQWVQSKIGNNQTDTSHHDKKIFLKHLYSRFLTCPYYPHLDSTYLKVSLVISLF